MKRLLLLLLLPVVLFAQGETGYVSTPIPLTAFYLGAGTTTAQPSDAVAFGAQPPPEPAIVAGYGSTFSVDLGVAPITLQTDTNGQPLDGVYTFSFTMMDYFNSYPGYAQIEIDYGTQELCSAEVWGIRASYQVTLHCGSPGGIVHTQALPGGGPPQGTNHLVLHGSVPSWQMYFYKFSVIFTPQP